MIELKMRALQQSIIHNGMIEEIKQEEIELQKQWEEWASQEETLWRKKSRISWLKDGGKNTNLFHKSMIQHKKQKKILNLKNKQGLTLSTHQEIEQELHQHFSNILKESNQDNEDHIKKITNNIPTILNREHNQMHLKK